MDPFATYLIVINIVTFIVFTIDFIMFTRDGSELANHAFLCAFAVAGGALGMLASFLVWDRRVVKRNVAWRFVAIILLIVWTWITLVVYGVLDVNPTGLLSNLGNDHSPVLIYLAAINVITFAAFCIDKIRALSGGWRIREAALLALSLVGGCVGGLVAMTLARHKINTWYFKYGLPVFLVLDIVAIGYLIQVGIA